MLCFVFQQNFYLFHNSVILHYENIFFIVRPTHLYNFHDGIQGFLLLIRPSELTQSDNKVFFSSSVLVHTEYRHRAVCFIAIIICA